MNFEESWIPRKLMLEVNSYLFRQTSIWLRMLLQKVAKKVKVVTFPSFLPIQDVLKKPTLWKRVKLLSVFKCLWACWLNSLLSKQPSNLTSITWFTKTPTLNDWWNRNFPFQHQLNSLPKAYLMVSWFWSSILLNIPQLDFPSGIGLFLSQPPHANS